MNIINNENNFDWIIFQTKLAKIFLNDFSNKSLHAGPVIVIFMGPMIFGALAFLSLMALYAPTKNLSITVFFIFSQALLISFPVIIFREKIYPEKLWLWRRGLPISLPKKIKADAIMLMTILSPIYFLSFISVAIWFWQWPIWLRLVWPYSILSFIMAILSSLLLSICFLWARDIDLKLPNKNTSDFVWPKENILMLRKFRHVYLFKELIFKSIIRKNLSAWWISNLLYTYTIYFMICHTTHKNITLFIDSAIYVIYLIWRDGLIRKSLKAAIYRIRFLPINPPELLRVSKIYNLTSVFIISTLLILKKLTEEKLSIAELLFSMYLILGAWLIVCKTISGSRERVALTFIYWTGLIILRHQNGL